MLKNYYDLKEIEKNNYYKNNIILKEMKKDYYKLKINYKLMKYYENIINENLNKLNEKKENNIYYHIIKDLLKYINQYKKDKIFFNYEFYNLNYYNIYTITYNYNDYNNYLYEKYNLKLCLNIFKNNDIEFFINELKNENEILYNELLEIKFNEIEKFIFKLFNDILYYLLENNLNINSNDYILFLYDLNIFIENDLFKLYEIK